MKKLLAITCILLTSIQLHAQPLSQLEERDLLLRVNTHFYPHLLPNSTIAHAKCGTPLMLELKTKWPRLSKHTQELIAPLVQFNRPQLSKNVTSPSGRSTF